MKYPLFRPKSFHQEFNNSGFVVALKRELSVSQPFSVINKRVDRKTCLVDTFRRHNVSEHALALAIPNNKDPNRSVTCSAGAIARTERMSARTKSSEQSASRSAPATCGAFMGPIYSCLIMFHVLYYHILKALTPRIELAWDS